MRICLVYDCLFPHTVGGAERWYRNLGGAARRGRTRSHVSDAPAVGSGCGPGRFRSRGPGGQVRAWAFTRRQAAAASCRRLCLGQECCGICCGMADAMTWSTPRRFPYFSLLAAAFARPFARFRLVVDWHEVWSREYWLDYLGSAAGRIGFAGAAAMRADRPAGVLLLAPARGAARGSGPARRRRRSSRASTRVLSQRAIPRQRSRWSCLPDVTSPRNVPPRSCQL